MRAQQNSHQVVAGPLREERNGDHDPQTPPVPRGLDEAEPPNVRCNLPVELNSSPDLLELVLNERVRTTVNTKESDTRQSRHAGMFERTGHRSHGSTRESARPVPL